MFHGAPTGDGGVGPSYILTAPFMMACLEPVNGVGAERLEACACVMANQRLLSLGILD